MTIPNLTTEISSYKQLLWLKAITELLVSSRTISHPWLKLVSINSITWNTVCDKVLNPKLGQKLISYQMRNARFAQLWILINWEGVWIGKRKMIQIGINLIRYIDGTQTWFWGDGIQVTSVEGSGSEVGRREVRGTNGSPDDLFTNLLIFFNEKSTHFSCLFISTAFSGVVKFFSSTIVLILGNKKLATALDCGVSCFKHAAVSIDADTRSSGREMLYTENSEAAMRRSLSGWRTWMEWISQRPAFGVRVMLYFA